MQVFFSYERTVRVLKWLTLALFAYVAVVLVGRRALADARWSSRCSRGRSCRPARRAKEYAAMVVAVLGTTISPYLFFWQATQEVEDCRRRPGRRRACAATRRTSRKHLRRIKLDTVVGMGFSNLVALCIVVATAVTLNQRGIINIQTSAQAAEALRPVAGEFAFLMFALGIVGTGLLAVPVLAGSAAYAVSELFGWKAGLSRGFHEARGFYLIIIAATGIGSAMGAFDVDPIKALVWSAIINGVISVPIMVVLMLIGQSRKLMGRFTITPRHRCLRLERDRGDGGRRAGDVRDQRLAGSAFATAPSRSSRPCGSTRRSAPMFRRAAAGVVAGEDAVDRLAGVDPGIEAERAGAAEGTVADRRIVLDPVADRVVPAQIGRDRRRGPPWRR